MAKNILSKYSPQEINNLDERICPKGACFATLPAKILEPGPGQRGQTSKMRQMCGEKKYDPLGFRPLSVAHGFVKEADGKHEFFFITDGLQRYTAITKTFGEDVLIPCFVTENFSEADQKYALFLINHNASLFSDRAKLWQNAVESGRDIIRKRLTEMFTTYNIGISGYDKEGNAILYKKGSNINYFRPGDLLIQYVFGENGRPAIAGGIRGYEIEFEAVRFALQLMSTIWADDKKRTDDILVLGLIYFYAKNKSIWQSSDIAMEKCIAAFKNKSADDIVSMAIKIMRWKDTLDNGRESTVLARFGSIWHGPAGYVVLKRLYEKMYRKEKNKLYNGYSESSENKTALFCFEKYPGIKKILRSA